MRDRERGRIGSQPPILRLDTPSFWRRALTRSVMDRSSIVQIAVATLLASPCIGTARSHRR
jgi:hypothetical protein